MRFVTDFADQAVVLPLAGAILIWLLGAGQRRAGALWAASVACTLGIVVVLKLLLACAPDAASLRSPSGHTASAALIAGGLAWCAGARRPWIVAIVAAIVIGTTRLALGVHTSADVLVGGGLGVAGTAALMLARPDLSPRMRRPWIAITAIALTIGVLHGTHLRAEALIDDIACPRPAVTSR
jgi:membrane-associated phospholipid phosphatase